MSQLNAILPNFYFENEYIDDITVGVDEAGRGPLAGPVVSACVLIDRNNYSSLINDSKKLSKIKRNQIYKEIVKNSKFGIGIVSNKIIDKINILNATKLSMRLAIKNFVLKYSLSPTLALIDGSHGFKFKYRNEIKILNIIKGDQKSISIAAASIIAKVTRDNIMENLQLIYPNYAWSKNSGYPTKEHINLIDKYGICEYHRKSFGPVKVRARIVK